VIIVGISALYHDSACAVLADGRLVAAAHEERFTRRRFDRSMPVNAFRACLLTAGLTIADVDYVAYYEDPIAKLGRQLWMGLLESPSAALELDWTGNGVPRLLNESLVQLDPQRPYREIRELLGFDGPVVTSKHHEAHAASAFYCSGYPDSALFTADAVGEWTTTSYGHADRERFELIEEVSYPHSLGILYSALTSYLGFEVNSDEYKVMALASAGEPRYVEKLREAVRDLPGGQFELNLAYFNLGRGDKMYSPALVDALGRPPRQPADEIDTFHVDVASSLQVILEELLLNKVGYLHSLVGGERLSYAGGVALNCVANSHIRRHGPYRDIYIQPAAGDAGGAIGAAALTHHRVTGTFVRHRLDDARLGPAYDARPIGDSLDLAGVGYADFSGREDQLLEATVNLLVSGAVVGWFQDGMEFGPRALGSRSILADPRDPGMRDRINALVKKREAFRPFAPAVPVERSAEFFEWMTPSPFMLEIAQVRDGAKLPAITHIDGSARLQTVDRTIDPRFHGLLVAFGTATGYPILLNTSFNMRGEPIVCDPMDALACFVRCQLDALVLGDLVIHKDQIPPGWLLAEAAIPYQPPSVTSDLYTFC
jgi:carbamoyltransferase